MDWPQSSLPNGLFMLHLRRAVWSDAPLLWYWRNDPATRAASRSTEPVPWTDHLAWLDLTLRSTSRALYLAEWDGLPIGTGRLDRHGLETELSWTIGPESRRQGYGRKLVLALIQETDLPCYACIKHDNHASIRIAQSLGLDVRLI